MVLNLDGSLDRLESAQTPGSQIRTGHETPLGAEGEGEPSWTHFSNPHPLECGCALCRTPSGRYVTYGEGTGKFSRPATVGADEEQIAHAQIPDVVPGVDVPKAHKDSFTFISIIWVFSFDMFCLQTFCPGVITFVYDHNHFNLFAGLPASLVDYDTWYEGKFAVPTGQIDPATGLELEKVHTEVLVDHRKANYQISTDFFFALYNAFNLAGGIIGRWLSYRIRMRHPATYLLPMFFGVMLTVLKIPVS